MRIRISADPPGPLRVLRELPGSRVALLEGLNGIGKTLSVRLLEICTGGQPYRKEPAAWASLCDGLGAFNVQISELSNDVRVEWVGDSRDWKDAEGPLFRSISIDGRPATIEDVRRRLVVHRISGDEGIVDTFALNVEEYAETVRRWRLLHAAPTGTPLSLLERRVFDASVALGEWGIQRLGEVQSAVVAADQAAAQSAQALAEIRDRVSALTELRRAHRLLQEAKNRLPDLTSQVDAVEAAIDVANQRKDEIQQKVMELAAKVGSATPQLKELENARRTLARNQGQLSGWSVQAAGQAADLGIEASEEAANKLLAEIRGREEALLAEQAELDAAPAMRNLLSQVGTELGDAERAGLGEQVAFEDIETEISFSVSRIRIGMTQRREVLEGQPPPPEAKRVTEELQAVRRKLQTVNNLIGSLSEVSRRRRLVAQNEQRVDAALALTDPSAVDQLKELEQERRSLDQRLLELASDRARLKQQMGAFRAGDDPETLETRVTIEADALGVDLADIESELAGVNAEEARLRAEDAAAVGAKAHAHREQARAETEMRAITARVTGNPEWAWLRAAAEATIPEVGSELAHQANALDRLRGSLAEVSERLGRYRAQLGAVESALFGVARQIRGQEPGTVEYVAELQSWFGRHFSEWFNTPTVRSALLENAEGDVVVDLAERQVNWTEAGIARMRPLEAFSSGEQAFAYTRARLAVLDEQTPRPENRLIVLDEFGAFMAHDRLGELLTYIREREASHPEDQILVMLPLNRNYGEMADSATGDDRKRLLAAAEQIERHKFLVTAVSG